ncbi:hypothetical protein H257_10793 [Aphanomyces astaci]|uniref:Uncharacterized protein n=1 Tax=Aphanomyces astaci TaxID=112090 RepID=W4G6J5_APHAT|nr:hypothetical protein H257_10793 [Aphanomyces astaci]ETV74669.1 hypothetical protein H257_10793 [Aphanomyces astaci]|eukprot:XP_009835756.1 hypothetical protein H257_10793 [Aphanomyces astaci]
MSAMYPTPSLQFIDQKRPGHGLWSTVLTLTASGTWMDPARAPKGLATSQRSWQPRECSECPNVRRRKNVSILVCVNAGNGHVAPFFVLPGANVCKQMIVASLGIDIDVARAMCINASLIQASTEQTSAPKSEDEWVHGGCLMTSEEIATKVAEKETKKMEGEAEFKVNKKMLAQKYACSNSACKEETSRTSS